MKFMKHLSMNDSFVVLEIGPCMIEQAVAGPGKVEQAAAGPGKVEW